jgi:hypothetical protein
MPVSTIGHRELSAKPARKKREMSAKEPKNYRKIIAKKVIFSPFRANLCTKNKIISSLTSESRKILPPEPHHR